MNIRRGKPGDFQAVLPMLRELRALRMQWDPVRYALHPQAELRFLQWIGKSGEDPRSLFLVAEDNGRIVGMLSATVEDNLPIYACEEYACIHDIWVDPPYRRRGAGEQLVTEAIRAFGEVGVSQLRITTAATNESGRRVLERGGMRVSAIEMLAEVGARGRRRARGASSASSSSLAPGSSGRSQRPS
jgi:GNAT superfamily N-acetyltransferase